MAGVVPAGGTPEARLAELGLGLPPPPRPVASYVPVVVSRGLAFVSGHGPLGPDGQPAYAGALHDRRGDHDGHDRIDGTLDRQAGRAAARLTVLNILGSLAHSLGSLSRIARVTSVRLFLVGRPGFAGFDDIADAASQLLTQVFGESTGGHARTTIPVAEAVFGLPVTVDAVFELKQ